MGGNIVNVVSSKIEEGHHKKCQWEPNWVVKGRNVPRTVFIVFIILFGGNLHMLVYFFSIH